MRLTGEMKSLADQIYVRETRKIAEDIIGDRQRVLQDAQKRNILNSGIYFGNLLRVEENHLKQLCEARAQSYIVVLNKAGVHPADDDVAAIMEAVSHLASRCVESLAKQMTQALRRSQSTTGQDWPRENLQRVADKTVFEIQQNISIEKGLREIKKEAVLEINPEYHGLRLNAKALFARFKKLWVQGKGWFSRLLK